MIKTTTKASHPLAKGLCLFLTLLIMACYLLFSEVASRSVLRGLSLCAKTLIPSIFPFLVLNGILLRCGLAELMGQRLGSCFQKLFGVSGHCAVPIIAGALCGFPTGAAGVAALRRQGIISQEDCRRGLLLASSASPGFLVVGVGAAMLGSPRYGVILYVIQLLAIFLVGFLDARLKKRKSDTAPQKEVSFSAFSFASALRASLHEATDAIISVCGSVVFFSGLTGILLSVPSVPTPLLCLLSSCLELTSGISLTASKLPTAPALVVIAAAVGFSSFSVHAQVAAVGEDLPMGAYMRKKAATSLLSASLTALFLHSGVL